MDTAKVGTTRPTEGGAQAPRNTNQFLYETFYGGAIGGSVIALAFLVLDSIGGRPLFTPSLIGSALFSSADPATVTDVRLDMVAYFTVAHFAAFLVLGGLASKVCSLTGLTRSSLPSVTVFVFAVLTVAFLGGSAVAMPGVVTAIGLPQVLGVNLLTAIAMALFLAREHRVG